MEAWRIALIVVLLWLLAGAGATIIPQCSRRMRSRLVALSRQHWRRAMERFAARREPTIIREQALHYWRGRDTDESHLTRSYITLITLGPIAFAFLWRIHRMRLPGVP